MLLTEGLKCKDNFLELQEDNNHSLLPYHNCLVGKLFTSKYFSASTIKVVLQKAWNLKDEFLVIAKRQ